MTTIAIQQKRLKYRVISLEGKEIAKLRDKRIALALASSIDGLLTTIR